MPLFARLYLVAPGCLLLLLLLAPARAEIYQWRDAEGRLHYGDRKPASTAFEEVSDRLQKTNVDDSAGEREKLGRVFSQETAAEKKLQRQQLQLQQRRQQQRQRQCASARRRLAVLQGPVYFTRADGSSYTISERERQQRAAEFESLIQRYCD